MLQTRINAGELRDVLSIIGVENEVDEYGFPIEIETELYQLRCKRKTISTKEYVTAGRQSTDLIYKFICPLVPDVKSSMKLKYNDEVWEVKHVHYIDAYYMELTAILFI